MSPPLVLHDLSRDHARPDSPRATETSMTSWLRRRCLRRRAFDLPLILAAIALAPHAYAQDVTPPAPPPSPPTQATGVQPRDRVQVRFEPEKPDLALMMRTGELPYSHVTRFASSMYDTRYYERGFVPLYSQICAGPCATDLAPGQYELAILEERASPAPGRGGLRDRSFDRSSVVRRPGRPPDSRHCHRRGGGRGGRRHDPRSGRHAELR